MPEHIRAYLYRIALAAIPILTVYGFVAESHAALWAAVAGAVLGTGATALASANTTTRRD